MTRVVVLHLLCPGEIQEHRHTPLGKDQVLTAVGRHLHDITLDAAYCSDMLATKEAVEIVLQQRDDNLNPVQQDWCVESLTRIATVVTSNVAHNDEMRRKPWHVLVGHKTEHLGEADIMQYTLRHNGNEWRLISSIHIRCPQVIRSTS